MNKRLLSASTAGASHSFGPTVRQVVPGAIADVDPFVFLDHFGPLQKGPGSGGVPPHPHAGIATVTYLFSGSNRHQDSRGNDAMVEAGDIAWMRAGKGIIHAEGMNEARKITETVHGLQFWISLPAEKKFMEPDFFFYPSQKLPNIITDEAIIKVLCGQLDEHRSPVVSESPAFIFELKAKKNTTLAIPLLQGDTTALYVISGTAQVEEKILLPTMIASFSTDGDSLEMTLTQDSHLILFGGTPLNEPIVGYGSYVMNTEAQIRKVIQDYHTGQMGSLSL